MRSPVVITAVETLVSEANGISSQKEPRTEKAAAKAGEECAKKEAAKAAAKFKAAGAAKSKGGKEAEAVKKEAEKAAAEFKDAEAAASTGHDSTKVGEIDKVRSKLRLYSSRDTGVRGQRYQVSSYPSSPAPSASRPAAAGWRGPAPLRQRAAATATDATF
jgi:hypothetical protein